MGAFLDKPKTDKFTAKGEGNGIRYGVSAMQGWRMEMEDSHVCKISSLDTRVCKTPLPVPFSEGTSFFGVFDGHAGPEVAKYCSKNLLESIVSHYDSKSRDTERIEKAILDGFIKLDESMQSQPPWSDGKDRSGTTAVVTMITPEHIFVGNCGDSRGILCRDRQILFSTSDHKPYNEKERVRIEKAGGTVMMQRVNGSLAVSRALGDFDYKRSGNLKPNEQLVSPEPEIEILERDPASDQFLLLACDGIFDVMSNEEVVEHVLAQLPSHQNPEDICSLLIDKCLNKNSRDNMSVVLVVFPGAPQFSKEALEIEVERQKKMEEDVKQELRTMVEAATDTIELEESFMVDKLQKEFPDSEYIYTRRSEIVDSLEILRKEKFGSGFGEGEDFNLGAHLSDPVDAPPEFAPLRDGIAQPPLVETLPDESSDSPPPTMDKTIM